MPKAALLRDKGVTVLFVDEHSGKLDLHQVLVELHKRQVLSVLVEGGSRLSASFIREKLVDKILIFIAPKLFGGDALSAFAPLGVSVPGQAVNLCFGFPQFFGRDLLVESYVEA